MQSVLTPAPSASGSEFPILDLAAFERTSGFLDPDAIRSYMQTLIDRSDLLLREIRDQAPAAAGTGDLVESAHALAGSASLLCFQRLAFAARSYEQAVETGSPEIPARIAQLVTAIEASLPEMQSLASR